MFHGDVLASGGPDDRLTRGRVLRRPAQGAEGGGAVAAAAADGAGGAARDAFLGQAESAAVSEVAERVAAEMISPYPPASPRSSRASA